MEKRHNPITRREVLKLGAAGGAVLTVLQFYPGRKSQVLLRAEDPSHAEAPRWAMLIDTGRCTGCGHCIKACKAHNDIAPGIEWNRILDTGEENVETRFLPVPCQHCEHAACVEACPVGATYHRPDGIVVMDYDRCIGCRYCEVACPYSARSFNWESFEGPNPLVPEWGEPEVARRPRGVVEKCTFCVHRIDRGLSQGLKPGVDPDATPVCVAACPNDARVFGDLNDPHSRINRRLAKMHTFQLRADWGTAPRVFYGHERSFESEVSS